MRNATQAGIFGALLFLAGLAVWIRDLRWLAMMSDTLPLALGIPLIAMVGGPWTLASVPSRLRPLWLVVALGGWGIGWMTESMTLLATGWAGLFWCWMRRHFVCEPRSARLILIAWMSFPWLVLDWPGVGWWFRLSAAKLVAAAFSLLALPVRQVGTSLEILGMPVEIQAACAGWNLLQLCVLTGLAGGIMELEDRRRFSVFLFLLPFIAWMANAARILMLSVIGLTWDSGVAGGEAHAPTAILVLLSVLALTRGSCLLLQTRRTTRSTLVHDAS